MQLRLRVVALGTGALLVAGAGAWAGRGSGPAGAVLLPPPPATALTAAVATPESLDAVFAHAGYTLPAGTDVFVARVVAGEGGEPASYVTYEAGGGATDTAFWPASSVKVLAAEGALEHLRTLGFSGAATVTSDDGWTATVADIYDAAIRESDNESYDRLVQIAGVDWLNSTFLTPANGFPVTVIQRSYVEGGMLSSPAMTVTEGGREVDLPPRVSVMDYGVPDDGNRSDLAEMTDSVRRVLLDAELPPEERLAVDPADIAGLADALLGADGWVQPGVSAALGPGALVYDKPGWVPGDECVDVGLVADPATATRFLFGIASPDDGGVCAALPEVAEIALEALGR